jgi:ribonucleoside-diphosphate reductase beta chain
MLLDPGMDLTLRPMKYPAFFDRFKDAIKNTWTVEEVDLHTDLADLSKLSPAEQHLVSRLVAFFATGDTIVSNNLVLNLYQHVNSPEGRLYLSRQLFEEAVHVQFYLNLLDTYVPDIDDALLPSRPWTTFRPSLARPSSVSSGSTRSSKRGC